jgi:hypothetical protein
MDGGSLRQASGSILMGGNASNRAALLKIREEIRVGDGYEKTLKTHWQYASPDLRLYSGSPQVCPPRCRLNWVQATRCRI